MLVRVPGLCTRGPRSIPRTWRTGTWTAIWKSTGPFTKVGSPAFQFRVAKTYRNALSRQVGEAVRIVLRQNFLNSKLEYTHIKQVSDRRFVPGGEEKGHQEVGERLPED